MKHPVVVPAYRQNRAQLIRRIADPSLNRSTADVDRLIGHRRPTRDQWAEAVELYKRETDYLETLKVDDPQKKDLLALLLKIDRELIQAISGEATAPEK